MISRKIFKKEVSDHSTEIKQTGKNSENSPVELLDLNLVRSNSVSVFVKNNGANVVTIRALVYTNYDGSLYTTYTEADVSAGVTEELIVISNSPYQRVKITAESKVDDSHSECIAEAVIK